MQKKNGNNTGRTLFAHSSIPFFADGIYLSGKTVMHMQAKIVITEANILIKGVFFSFISFFCVIFPKWFCRGLVMKNGIPVLFY